VSGFLAQIASLAADSLAASRATRVSFAPAAADWRASAKPIPLDPPVINTC
jgi:hypothetical protein